MTYQSAFDALGDPTRRAVFERLQAGALAVGEIAAGLPVSRPAVSQHLKVLKEVRLVRERVAGTRHLYEVDPRGLGEVRAWLDRFRGDALAAFKAEVERQAPARGRKRTR